MTNFAFAVLLKGIDQLSDPLGAVGGKFGELGAKATKLGKDLVANVSLPLAGIFALAARESMQGQEAQRMYALATGKSADEIARLGTLLRQLPPLAEDDEQLAALTAYEQAGIAVGDSVLEVAGASQTLAFALGGQVVDAARASGAVLKAWNLDAKESGAVTDALAAAAFKANIPIETMSEQLAKAAPLATATGQSLAGTAAQLITFERLGLDGAAAMKKALLELQAPSEKSREVFSRLGLGESDFVNADGTLKDLASSMELLSKRGATASDFAVVFGNRIGPGLERFGREGAAGMRALTEEIERGGIAQDGADKKAKTLGGQFSLLGTAWSNALGNLGDAAVAGPLGALLEQATKLAEWVGSLSPTTLSWVSAIAAAAAAAGPVLLALGTAVKMIGVMKVGLGVLKPLVSGVFGPWGIALSILLAVGTEIWENWDSIVGVLKEAWDVIANGIGAAFDWVYEKVLAIAEGAKVVWRLIKGEPIDGSTAAATATQSAAATSSALANRTLQRIDPAAIRSQREAPAGRIVVDFKNAPPGMRPTIEQSDGIDIETKRGLSMAGAY